MASSNLPFFLSFPTFIIAIVLVISTSPSSIKAVSLKLQSTERGGRSLLSFKETPRRGNGTFECSPSGPCVPCLYSEKNEEKFRCSETGYRIPLKCVEIEDGSKEKNDKKPQKSRSALENTLGHSKEHEVLRDEEELATPIKHRRLLDDPSTMEGGGQAYITYRSCIPAVNEEKLSVLGFEGIMMCLLLLSGSVTYIRRKRTVSMSGVGAVRIPTNSRF